jgi:hypothetical protein
MIAAKLIPFYCALYLQDISSAAGKKALTVLPELVMCGLFAAILISIEIGYRTGLRRRARAPQLTTGESKAIETSVFGLMGLLIAFIFAAAAVRFDTRKMLIAQEANAIETAYLRLDLLPLDSQPELRKDFRAYLMGRLGVARDIPDMSAVNADLRRSAILQHKIWEEAVQAVQGTSNATQQLVLSALNEMIAITTVRTIGIISHLPFLVVVLLVVIVLLSSFLTGYSMSASQRRDWLSAVIFAIAVSSATYVTLDYEYPRVGFIRTDSADRVLIETLDRMQ